METLYFTSIELVWILDFKYILLLLYIITKDDILHSL